KWLANPQPSGFRKLGIPSRLSSSAAISASTRLGNVASRLSIGPDSSEFEESFRSFPSHSNLPGGPANLEIGALIQEPRAHPISHQQPPFIRHRRHDARE